MMADKAPVMHKDFPRWYAAVVVGDDAQVRAGRWAAVHTITQGADAPMIEGLVRLAFAQLPMDLPALAEAAIERLADANRTRPSLNALVRAEAPKFDFETAATKAKESNWEAVGQAFTLAANSVRTAITALAARQASATRAIDRFIQVQDEELQMLWWLIGGRSVTLDCAFDAVPADAQPLVFASELADNTASFPGPRSIRPLLTRAGLKERKKLTLAAALGATPATWLEPLVGESNPSPVTHRSTSPSSVTWKRAAATPGSRTGRRSSAWTRPANTRPCRSARCSTASGCWPSSRERPGDRRRDCLRQSRVPRRGNRQVR